MMKSSTRINYYIIILRQLRYKKKISPCPELHSTSRVHFTSCPFSEGNCSVLRKCNFEMGSFLIGFDGNIWFWKTRTAILIGCMRTYYEIPNCTVIKSSSNFCFVDTLKIWESYFPLCLPESVRVSESLPFNWERQKRKNMTDHIKDKFRYEEGISYLWGECKASACTSKGTAGLPLKTK